MKEILTFVLSYCSICLVLSNLGNNGTSNGDTYLYHETNQSYTDGPTLPIHNYKGSCTAFASKSHGYRPVVVYVPDSHSTIYLWDYTMSNKWETCKYTVYLHKAQGGLVKTSLTYTIQCSSTEIQYFRCTYGSL